MINDRREYQVLHDQVLTHGWSYSQTNPNDHIISTFGKGKNLQMALFLFIVPIKQTSGACQSAERPANILIPPSVLIPLRVYLKIIHPSIFLNSVNKEKHSHIPLHGTCKAYL